MSELSEKWLKKYIAEMEAMRDEIPFGFDADENKILQSLKIALAAHKLVKCKGRYHSELNYKELANLFGVKTHEVNQSK